jgi:hypothetical protein
MSQPSTPAPVAATPPPVAPTPITPTLQRADNALDKAVLVVEGLSLLLSILGLTGIGKEVKQWLQGLHGRRSSSSTAAAGANPGANSQHSIQSAPFGIGPADEAAIGLALATAYKDAGAITADLKRLNAFISNTLNQGQRDFLRGAFSKMDGAERVLYFIQLAKASSDEKSFINFMRAQGIIRDPSPLAAGIARGITASVALADSRTLAKRAEIRRDINSVRNAQNRNPLNRLFEAIGNWRRP